MSQAGGHWLFCRALDRQGRLGSLHWGALVGARLTATLLIDRAVPTSPVVIASTGAIWVALPMPAAAIQAMRQHDCSQVVTYLIQAHGVVDGNPPKALCTKAGSGPWTCSSEQEQVFMTSDMSWHTYEG